MLRILLYLLAWIIIGCAALATFDREDQLLIWTHSAPYGLGFLVILLWPVVLAAFYRRRSR